LYCSSCLSTCSMRFRHPSAPVPSHHHACAPIPPFRAFHACVTVHRPSAPEPFAPFQPIPSRHRPATTFLLPYHPTTAPARQSCLLEYSTLATVLKANSTCAFDAKNFTHIYLNLGGIRTPDKSRHKIYSNVIPITLPARQWIFTILFSTNNEIIHCK